MSLYRQDPIGITYGDLSGGGVFSFITSESFTLPPRTSLLIFPGLYVKSQPEVVNVAANFLVLDSVFAFASKGEGPYDLYTGIDVPGQKLYVASQADIVITLDASTPKEHRVAMGADNTLAVWGVKNNTPEKVCIERSPTSILSTAPESWNNLRMYNGSLQVGTTLSSLSVVHTGTAVGGDVDHICLAENASDVDNAYKGMAVTITAGSSRRQSVTITNYRVGEAWCSRKAYGIFKQTPDSTSAYEVGNQAVFYYSGSLCLQSFGNIKLRLNAFANLFPTAVSASRHTTVFSLTFGAPSAYSWMIRGADSNTYYSPFIYHATATEVRVYETTPTTTISANSPGGVQSPGQDRQVIRWLVSASGEGDVGLYPPLVQSEGTAMLTGSGGMKLYSAQDLQEPLAEVKSKTVEFQAVAGVDETLFQSPDPTACYDFGMMDVVRIYDASAADYMAGSTGLEYWYIYGGNLVSDQSGNYCTLRVVDGAGNPPNQFADGDLLIRRPGQPGGFTSFGFIGRLPHMFISGGNRVTYPKDGRVYTLGVRLAVAIHLSGHDSAGNEVSSVDNNCVVYSFNPAVITFSGCHLDSTGVIDPSYDPTQSERHQGSAMVTTFASTMDKVAGGVTQEYILSMNTLVESLNTSIQIILPGEFFAFGDGRTPFDFLYPWEDVVGRMILN